MINLLLLQNFLEAPLLQLPCSILQNQGNIDYAHVPNVLFTLNRTTHSSKTLLCTIYRE